MRRVRPFSSSFLPFTALLILLAVPCAAQAQSGRRAATGKGSATPAPSPAPPVTPPAAPARPPVKPQHSLLVLSDVSQNLYFSIPYPERVQGWVTKRLRESPALEVAAGDRANRSEAIKRAKASAEGFVLFLRLDESGSSPAMTRTGGANLDDVSISYALFSPVTGKAKSSGVVYLNQRNTIFGGGPGSTMPLCYPNVRGTDYILLQASLEIASRIMAALNIPETPLCT
jgi:hypothetical protein